MVPQTTPRDAVGEDGEGSPEMNVGEGKITKRPPLFGQILLEQGKITHDVLDAALKRQAEQRRYIGEILCELGHIRAADIEEALKIQRAYGLV
jgi:hypothetical protein